MNLIRFLILKYTQYTTLFFLMVVITVSNGQNEVKEHKNLKFKHFSLTEGLSQSSVLCILQDKKGFFWFGTRDGLNKYDGHTFTTYRHNSQDPSSISNSFIKSLFEDVLVKYPLSNKTCSISVMLSEPSNWFKFKLSTPSISS